ncbi:hypothetical protein [Gynuella sunshinyii]|uniref:Outer membrane protein beta-barrel domain-containing protein n=1 Tax=Gynuella sunshinyii YC6258 TaxID=1445510 RepID=A0A0C5VNK9_9GAMM|nr:hypothetical protein [Gynuella sunshinyii]AJQ95901.1 hypothetical Protein YC6258_03865 [Gynuella sunshinyii YC6258]
MKKIINLVMLLATLTVPVSVFAASSQSSSDGPEGDSGILIKALGSQDHFYGLIGLAKYDNYDKNMGYFAYERYGKMDELEGKSDDSFRVSRFSLKGDAYASATEPAKWSFTGAKVDLYYATTEAENDYEWKNFGIGLGAVMTPVPGLKDFHITPGVQYESKYLSFDWSKDQDAQYDWYVDAEIYVSKRLAIVGQYNRFMVGELFDGEELQEMVMVGFRFFL